MLPLEGKNVVLGVTAGIAAYKSVQIVSNLKKLGAAVDVIQTEHSCKFVAPLSFQSISGRPVVVDMFKEPAFWEIQHISLARKADVFLVAPATANFIGKYANGIADDMLSTTVLATKAPVLLAPAMNTVMWNHAAVQSNIDVLKKRGVLFTGPASGLLACGEMGAGRMAEPDEITSSVVKILTAQQDMKGLKVLVTAGPAQESIDPVRFISNHSSGKMGYAIAQEALSRGAEVSLAAGKTNLDKPIGANVLNFTTTEDLYGIMIKEAPLYDIVIQAAAPADFKIDKYSEQKIKKQGREEMNLRLVPTVDVAKAIGEHKKKGQIFIGFAAETENGMESAKNKLVKKNLDIIVMNNIAQENAGFQVDSNIVTIIDKNSFETLPLMSKRDVAKRIIDKALAKINKAGK